ncbi:MAG: hypothetical protein ACJ75H_05985 [Thermoanaerobaculia bacterium]
MVTRNPFPGGRGMGGFGLSGPVPRDLLVLIGVLIATLALKAFDSTRIVPALLELTPLAWQRGFLWQLVTYPFIGAGGPGFGFLLELLFLYMFGRDVFWGLYRRHFWRMTVFCAVAAGAVAVATDALMTLAGSPAPMPFVILQGQHVLLALFAAAFATAHSDAQILLMFILPVPARWLFAIEILFAFMAFLNTRDLPGFLGICAAVGFAYLYVKSSGSAKGGKRIFREMRLRMQRWWIQRKLDRAKRKRGFRVIPGDKGRNVRKGPWVN